MCVVKKKQKTMDRQLIFINLSKCSMIALKEAFHRKLTVKKLLLHLNQL